MRHKISILILLVMVFTCLPLCAEPLSNDQALSLNEGGGQGQPSVIIVPEKQVERRQLAPAVVPKPMPESNAERFFSTPTLPLGKFIGGEPRTKEVTPSAIADPLTQLLSLEGGAIAAQKVRLFKTLDKEDQERYLQTLSLRERQTFLKSLGDEGVWFDADLSNTESQQHLEQFGYDFFTSSRPVLPEASGLVGPDYIVGPGDVLNIDIWGSLNGTFRIEVGRNGEIVLPKIGAIQLWGQSFAQIRETIRKQIAKYYSDFEVNVSLGALRSIQVYVVGEVNQPGTYTVNALSTVLNVLHAAGGPTKQGSLRNLRLMRAGETVSPVDLYDFFLTGDRSHDVRLQSGDTVFVPVAVSQVGVSGEVRRPAIYELVAGENLATLLEMAGGVTAMAVTDHVQIERVDDAQGKVILDYNLDLKGKKPAGSLKIPLADRDLVRVSSLPTFATRYVRLTGYVNRPGRFEWVPGMRVGDLLTNDNLLPGYFTEMAEILRIQPPYYRPEKITFNPELAAGGNPENNHRLLEFDEVHIFSRKQMEELSTVNISGAVNIPGKYQLYANMTVRDLIMQAGNIRNFAYLSQAELSRFTPVGKETRSERVLIDLDKALHGDAENNLELQAEDHLFVRSVPDYNERLTVTVGGEVLFPGTYAISKQETLSSVLQRAGGYTGEAYLRGATLSRESVKALQKANVEKLIAEQEKVMAQLSFEIASGAVSAEELASAKILLESRKEMINKLRNVPLSGRIASKFLPLEELAGSDMDISLRAGDEIVIPRNPMSVAVLGEVYNPVSLIYRPGQTVGYYLDRVGGIKETANEKEMFVVRADGTVLSNKQAGLGVRWNSDRFRWEFGGFYTEVLWPGDTILVPEKVDKIAVMRNVKDISTIFYQLALGAAAIASF